MFTVVLFQQVTGATTTVVSKDIWKAWINLTVSWCYLVLVSASPPSTEHTPSTWEEISGNVCGGKRQSPIDIVTSKITTDPNLRNFTIQNFSSEHAIESILNNGHTGTTTWGVWAVGAGQQESEVIYIIKETYWSWHASSSLPCVVKCILKEGEIKVSGGGLNGTYSALQFHFHWGQRAFETHPGSEHTVDGHRYPMEVWQSGLTSQQSFSLSVSLNLHCVFLSPHIICCRCTSSLWRKVSLFWRQQSAQTA